MHLVKIPDYIPLLPHSCSFLKSKHYAASSPSSTDQIRCTLIPGDGVGPESIKSVRSIFRAAAVPIEFEKHIFSELHPEQSEPLETVLKSVKKNRICLQGVIAVPDKSPDGNPNNWNTRLREALDLYANVVYIKSLTGVPCKYPNANFVIIRDQTEGSFKETLEHETAKGVAESLKILTRKKSERIAKFAFDYAVTHYKKRLVAVHKANVFRVTDGLFLDSCRKIAAHYPKIKFTDMSIGSCAFELTKKPQQFDIILTPSLYGSVIENIGVGVVGGAGVVAACSYSPRCAIFEPGSRDIHEESKGMNIANPTAMILAAIKLLRHVRLIDNADVIEDALFKVLREGEVMTRDVGGDDTTHDFTRAIIDCLDLDRIYMMNEASKPKKSNVIYKLSTCM